MNGRLPDLIPVLKVSDLDRSLAYYTKVLGFRVEEFDRFYPKALLRFSSIGREGNNGGDSDAMVSLQARDGDRRHIRIAIGLHADVEHFEAYFGQLKERGAKIVEHVSLLDMPFFSVRDPDGYFIDFGRYLDPLPATGDDQGR